MNLPVEVRERLDWVWHDEGERAVAGAAVDDLVAERLLLFASGLRVPSEDLRLRASRALFDELRNVWEGPWSRQRKGDREWYGRLVDVVLAEVAGIGEGETP